MAWTLPPLRSSRFPLFTLLSPRKRSIPLIKMLGLGVLLGRLAMLEISAPLWIATSITLLLLLYPAIGKWRDDARAWGRPLMGLSILVALQSFHSLEHLVQWVQFHVFHWAPKFAGGLVSAANAEVVHFVWNWGVVLVVSYLLWRGVRNIWMWLLLGWALAHTFEHTYMFVNYVQQVIYLRKVHLPISLAQGMPGILGRNGWLAITGSAQRPLAFLCAFAPAVKTAHRIDVHFWWNFGETLLLLLGARTAMQRYFKTINQPGEVFASAPVSPVQPVAPATQSVVGV